jgi:hypothetical protein
MKKKEGLTRKRKEKGQRHILYPLYSKMRTWVAGVAQWQRPCLAYSRPRFLPPILQRVEEGKEGVEGRRE